MRKQRLNLTYLQKMRWWFVGLITTWVELPRWWRANRYAWTAAVHSLLELFGLIFGPLFSLTAPILALLEQLHSARKLKRARSKQ